MLINPREYQQEAHDATFSYLKKAKGHPVIEMPTGSGKSVVIAMMLKTMASIGYRAIILHRSKELVQQNMERFKQLCPDLSIGAYSASMGERQVEPDFVFATIQSVAEKALQFGQRNAVFVDECHQISVSENSQYQTFLRELKLANPGVRMIGLTATPYRLDNGPICGDGMPFDGLSYRVPVRLLLDEGHITPLESLSCSRVDTSSLRKSGWDFNKQEMASLFGDITETTVQETILCAKAKGTTSNLIFTSGIEHAEKVQAVIEKETGDRVGIITGDTLPLERSTTLADFKEKRIKWLVNCDVLTTGFDAPCVDLIAVMRATESAGLFSQICGRGMRLYPGKEVCYLLDFGGNVERHGPIDSDEYGHKKAKEKGNGQAPIKSCPSCGDECPAGARECGCGFQFPPPQLNVESQADGVNDVMEATAASAWTQVEVAEVKYFLHRKEGKPDSVRVIYKAKKGDKEIFAPEYSDWWCFEHEGVARSMCIEKWNKHSHNPCPETTAEALMLMEAGAVAEPKYIMVKQDGKWWRVKTPRTLDKPVKLSLEDLYEAEEDPPF